MGSFSNFEATLAFTSGLVILFSVIYVDLAVLMIASDWKLFTKAGEEGWASLIPVYNLYVTIKIAFSGSKNWLILFYLVTPIGMLISTGLGLFLSLASLGVSIYISYQFVRRYADAGLSIMALFFPIIVYPIIAFSGKYEYEEYF